MHLQKCEFTRKKGQSKEEGIMVNDCLIIIDAQGKLVDGKIYDYVLIPYSFSVSVPLKGE